MDTPPQGSWNINQCAQACLSPPQVYLRWKGFLTHRWTRLAMWAWCTLPNLHRGMCTHTHTSVFTSWAGAGLSAVPPYPLPFARSQNEGGGEAERRCRCAYHKPLTGASLFFSPRKLPASQWLYGTHPNTAARSTFTHRHVHPLSPSNTHTYTHTVLRQVWAQPA